MDAHTRSSLLMGAALGLLALLALKAIKAGAASISVANVAADVVSGAVGVVTDTAAGAVLGVGDAVGVPRTDAMLCEIAKANGDALGASKYCTAGDFIAWTLSGQPSGASASEPAPVLRLPDNPADNWVLGSD